MIKSGLHLSCGNGFAALVGLARNVLIARLISVEDFAIASTFAVTMALIEMTSNIAIDRLIVQARDGETERLQSTAQLIEVGRGALCAIVLFLIAEPLALLFGVPEVTWAYQALAAIPLLRGFVHLDIFRLQREMRFMPWVTVEAGAQIAATGAAIPLALALGDYTATLYVLLIQQVVFLAASHAVAIRRYRLGFSGDIASRAFAFGWPLVLNGILMFGVMHGDRIIIGNAVGLTELGWFSAAVTLTVLPSMLIRKTLLSFFLPLLARAQDDKEASRNLQKVVVEATLLIGALFAAGCAIAGPAILVTLYGSKYGAAAGIIVWLAVMQGLQIAKAGLSIVAIANAKTRIPYAANLACIAMLPLAWIAADAGGGVTSVVMFGIVGQGLSILVSLFLIGRSLSFKLEGLGLPITATVTMLVLSCLVPLVSGNGALTSETMNGTSLTLAAIALSVLLAVQFWSMRTLRHWSSGILRASRQTPKSA